MIKRMLPVYALTFMFGIIYSEHMNFTSTRELITGVCLLLGAFLLGAYSFYQAYMNKEDDNHNGNDSK
jgi:hypothetical protein